MCFFQYFASKFVSGCVCVCVCVREREREIPRSFASQLMSYRYLLMNERAFQAGKIEKEGK